MQLYKREFGEHWVEVHRDGMVFTITVDGHVAPKSVRHGTVTVTHRALCLMLANPRGREFMGAALATREIEAEIGKLLRKEVRRG